jgi:hypothetical protein
VWCIFWCKQNDPLKQQIQHIEAEINAIKVRARVLALTCNTTINYLLLSLK